jgi:enoyl-CoA hydratase
MTRDAKRVFSSLVDLHIPVVAAVQGAAAGMGATIVTLCDIVVAYRHAKIADPHVAVGIVAGDGGIIGWSQSIGLTRAKRFLLTGDALTAEDGFAMGLVTDLVDTPETVLAKAEEIATRIAALPRAGVQGTKRAFARLTQQTALAAFDIGLAYEMESMTRPEVAEAIARLRK